MHSTESIHRIMDKFGCDASDAERYLDLREEGYPRYQALLMAGLTDPEDSED